VRFARAMATTATDNVTDAQSKDLPTAQTDGHATARTTFF